MVGVTLADHSSFGLSNPRSCAHSAEPAAMSLRAGFFVLAAKLGESVNREQRKGSHIPFPRLAQGLQEMNEVRIGGPDARPQLIASAW